MKEHPNLATALAAFQADLPHVGKANKANTGTFAYDYADLADVAIVVLPALAEHGLSWITAPTLDDSGRFVLAYRLQHTSGQELTGCYPLGNPGNPQAMGSAITYARRYCLCAVTGVSPDKDDDGAAATQYAKAPERAAESRRPAGADQRAMDRKWSDAVAEINAATDGATLTSLWKRWNAENALGYDHGTGQSLGARIVERRQLIEDVPAEVTA